MTGKHLCLLLDLLIFIGSGDSMWSFMDMADGISFSKYVMLICSNNTHSSDCGMLLKIFLFVFMEGYHSLSEIAHLYKSDTCYLYLSNQRKPNFMAFQRIVWNMILCDTDIQYIDGTVIEANAHKNSFVYKMNSEYRGKINTIFLLMFFICRT